MPRCPSCRHSFRVMEDEDDGQHDCPRCGYSKNAESCCSLCGCRLVNFEDELCDECRKEE